MPAVGAPATQRSARARRALSHSIRPPQLPLNSSRRYSENAQATHLSRVSSQNPSSTSEVRTPHCPNPYAHTHTRAHAPPPCGLSRPIYAPRLEKGLCLRRVFTSKIVKGLYACLGLQAKGQFFFIFGRQVMKSTRYGFTVTQ